jgi:glucosamine--fructose-6-phosphate aminotransferase (isomerizing)
MNATGTHLEHEIREQPDAIMRLVLDHAADAARIGAAVRGLDLRYALIAARGSSDNAARYGQYLFGERLGLPVALAAPSLESLYGAGAVPRHGEGLVIGISQSGRSPDVVSVLAAASVAGAPTIAITNVSDSPLAEVADFVVELHAGTERSIAATKTYTTSLAALAALVAELRDDDADRAALRRVPSLVQRALDAALARVGDLDHHADAAHVLAVGRGYNYATAMEVALKVRELTRAVAEGFSSADLMHGPIAATAPGTPAIVVAPAGRALASVLETSRVLRERGAEPILIAEQSGADLPLPGDVPEWLSPIVAVVPGQVLAMRHAVLRGGEIDAPAGLTKVTETY